MPCRCPRRYTKYLTFLTYAREKAILCFFCLSLFSRSSLGHGGNRGFKRFINSGFFLQCSQETIQNGKENQYFTSALMYELEPVLAETKARKKLEQDHHGTVSREEPKKSTIRTITTKKSARVRVSIFVSERRSIGRNAHRKDASKHIQRIHFRFANNYHPHVGW